MLGVLNTYAAPRRFQGGGPLLPRSLRGWHGLGDTGDFLNLSGSVSADAGVYSPPSVDMNPCDFNVCTTPSSVSTSVSGPSTASLITGITAALAPIGAVLAKNLTTPYATSYYNPATGAYMSSSPVGVGSPQANAGFGLASLTGSLQGMLPLLLLGGLAIMFVGAAKR